MISSKRFIFALAALVLVVLGTTAAFAATTPQFNVTTAVPFVANTGRSEVMGQVTLSADITCALGTTGAGADLIFGTADDVGGDGLCVSTAGTIQVLYVGTPIDDAIATVNVALQNTNGIEVCETIATVAGTHCNVATAGGYITPTFTVTNTSGGGVVSFGVKGGVDFKAGDQVIVRGVRGQIDLGPGNVVGSSVFGQLTTSPSTIAGFSPVQQEVARSADPLTVAFKAYTILTCQPKIGKGTVTITEGFNTAFVDQDNAGAVVDPADTQGATANARPLFAASSVDSLSANPTLRVARNSRVNIVLTGKPAGITIGWPAASAADSGTGGTGAKLLLVSQSVPGDTALYVFTTGNQATSDINGEKFVITVDQVVPAVTLKGDATDFGTATGQAQMFDGTVGTATTTVAGSQPRYNHPLEPVPGSTFLTVAPCTTNLLFPWVLNFANADTGIAIANTSADPYGTLPQTGTCTLNLFPTDKTTNNGVSVSHPAAAVALTTANVEPGSIWRASMSGTPAFAGLAGYIIAVCRFQYGHGFAFITDNFPNSPVAAQGYVALVIPDPLILPAPATGANARSVAVSGDDRNCLGINAAGVGGQCAPPYGEGLGQ